MCKCKCNVAVLILRLLDTSSICLLSRDCPRVFAPQQTQAIGIPGKDREVNFKMLATESNVETMDSKQEESGQVPSEQDKDNREGEDRSSPVNFESKDDNDSVGTSRRNEAGYQSSQTMSEKGDTASQEHVNDNSKRSSPCSEVSAEEIRDHVSSRLLGYGEIVAHNQMFSDAAGGGQQYYYDGQRSERSDAATVCSRSVADEIEASEVSSVHSQQDRLPEDLAGATISSPSAEKNLPRHVMDSIASAPRQPSNVLPTQYPQPRQTLHTSSVVPVTTSWRSMGPPFNRSTLLKHTRETDSEFPRDGEHPGWGRRVYAALHQHQEQEKLHSSSQDEMQLAFHQPTHSVEHSTTTPGDMPHLSLGAAAAESPSALLLPSRSEYDPRRSHTGATRRPQEELYETDTRRARSRSRSPDDRKPAAK